MRFSCKLIIINVIGLIIFCSLIASASTIKVEKFSMPVKIPNKISQQIFINFSPEGNWKILVESLESQINNIDNPSHNLPISRLELAEMNGTPITRFDVGKVCELKSGSASGMNNLNLALNAVNFDSDPPGNYIADIKFTLLNDNSVVAEDVFCFRFLQDTIASIDFSRRAVNLKLDKDKILRKNSSQSLPMPVGVYVSSNKNWKLYVRDTATSQNQNLKYFVKVLSAFDSSITCNQSNDYIPLQNIPILLASGKSTINNMSNSLEKKLINIDYMVKGPEDKFIPAGSTSEEFEYRLETEE